MIKWCGRVGVGGLIDHHHYLSRGASMSDLLLLARIRDVSMHSCDIIAEVVRDGNFPLYEIVLSVLCQRYGVLDFHQLHCGGPSNIPALNTLLYIQTKLQPWIVGQLAVRSILCIADLDYECYQLLRQLGVGAVLESGSADRKSDPCEVDLDADEQPDCAQQELESFLYFGLGPLQRHPMLVAYFDQSVALQDCIGSECVLQYLLDYLSNQRYQGSGGGGGSSSSQAFSCNDFVQYLCAELSVGSLYEVGACIRGDLCAERLALQHVVQQRYRLFVEVTKRELEHFNQQMSALEGNNDTKRHQGRKKRRRQAQIEGDQGAGAESVEAVDAGQVEGVALSEQKSDAVSCPVRDEQGLAPRDTIQRGDVESEEPKASTPVAAGAAEGTRCWGAASTSAVGDPPPVYTDSGYETKMRIYTSDLALDDGVGTGATPAGGYGSAGEIYTIETSELQGCLPFIPAPSATSGASIADGTAGPVLLDSRGAGRWGEALVHQYLLSRRGVGCAVHWLNEAEESRAAYDFTISAPCGRDADLLRASQMHRSSAGAGGGGGGLAGGGVRTEYIEVKTTRFGDRNVFELSPFEWQFAAAEPRLPYHIYRVFAAGDPARVRILVVRDVYNRVLEGRVKLCLAT